MTDDKLDRRVQRTRDLLRTALMQLIREKGYDAVTIQDITDRANLGRTTFYLHYQTKDDLLVDHHADFANSFNIQSISPEQLLGHEPAQAMITFLQELQAGKQIYFAIKRAKDADIILDGIRQQMIGWLEEAINTTFSKQTPNIKRDVLVNYIVGAQLSLLDWWLCNHTTYSAEQIATQIHQLQRAAICSAFGVPL